MGVEVGTPLLCQSGVDVLRSVTMIRRNRGAVAEDSGGSRVKRPKLGGRLPGKLGNAAGDSARGLGLVHCYWRRKLEDTSGEQASRASGLLQTVNTTRFLPLVVAEKCDTRQARGPEQSVPGFKRGARDVDGCRWSRVI